MSTAGRPGSQCPDELRFLRGSENAAGSMFFGIILMCLTTTLMVPQEKTEKPVRQTLTISKCEKCGLTKVKDYEEGDYVLKITEKCNKCDVSLKIVEVYSVKLKEKDKSKEKSKKNKKNKIRN